MSYDFFVLPAEQAADLDEAVARYESAPVTVAVTPGSPAERFVAALNDGDHDFLQSPAAGHRDTAYVATSWSDPMANLRVVAGAARDEGLSVLDVQLNALYDPRDALDVGVDTQGGPQLPYLTRGILRQVMTHIRELRYHWVTLTREDRVFVQTFRDDDGSWAVEHREGGPDRHFAARSEDAETVERLLWSWARHDGRWQAMLVFSPVEL